MLIGLYSFSKSYCVPGHRLGAIMASEAALAEIGKVLDCFQICPAAPGQPALAPGIGALAGWRDGNRARDRRRAAALSAPPWRKRRSWRVDSVGAYFAFVAHPLQGVGSPEVARAAGRGARRAGAARQLFRPRARTRHLRIAFANATSDALARLPERLRGLAA